MGHEKDQPQGWNAEKSGSPEPEIDRPDLNDTTWDVVIVGAGLAGLTLARQLLLETDRRVLLVERRAELPQEKQKVGESTVQLAGYYLSKVLDLEEHLLHEHFMKYNLRFYWRSPQGEGMGFEDYSSAYIRRFSNIPSYQIDRNAFEGHVLGLCELEPRFRVQKAALDLEIDLAEAKDEGGLHDIAFRVDGEKIRVRSRWVIDTTGRRRFLAKKRELLRPAPIRHGAFVWWVEGLIDIERLTELDITQRRRHARRRETGHTPSWLATNHFCDRGLWFWVIPLRGKTSLGLVFDHSQVEWRDVSNVEKATRFVCERFPLFARDLPKRKITSIGGYKDFAHDCVQTLSAGRWAMTGESGRFSDPLYSPGSDLIAIHNTLIVHAIGLEDPEERKSFCQLSESLLKAVYHAYVPGYVETYECLGDEECFTIKYVWELTIYFAFYVFPFINDLFTDRRFVVGFLRQFSRLGVWNRGIQKVLAGYAAWKRQHRRRRAEPVHMDFMDVCSLRRAEKTFYEVDASAGEGKRILAEQMVNLEELTRFLAVHIAAEVIGEPSAKTDRAFVESIDIENLEFEPAAWKASWASAKAGSAAVMAGVSTAGIGAAGLAATTASMASKMMPGAASAAPSPWSWNLDPGVFDPFRTELEVKSPADGEREAELEVAS